jgi:hypothetical protein
MMRSKLAYSALLAVSLFGSTLTASAQTGAGDGAGAAAIPGREVRAGEQRSNVQPEETTGSAARSNAMQSESQYTIGEKQGRGPGDKPDASEVAPAGH